MTTTAFKPAPGPSIRYPLQRIMDLTRAESYAQLAEWLGESAGAVRKWAERGLSSKQADFVASKLGYWPGSVWTDFNADLVPDDADYDVDLVVGETADNDWLHLNCWRPPVNPSVYELLCAALGGRLQEDDCEVEEPDAPTGPSAVPAPEVPLPRPYRASMWPSLPRVAGPPDRADAQVDLPAVQPREQRPASGKWNFAAPRPNPGFRPGFGQGGAR